VSCQVHLPVAQGRTKALNLLPTQMSKLSGRRPSGVSARRHAPDSAKPVLRPSNGEGDPRDMQNVSDEALVRQFKQGDDSAFNGIVRRYQEKLYYVALRMVNDHDEASDLSQEAFVRAYEGLAKFEEGSSLYTWLYRIVVNLCINHLRARKARQIVSLDALVEPLASSKHTPEQDAEQKDFREAVGEAVEQLPPRQKAVFILRQYEQLSHEEIARTLGRSVGAVKANYFHAVKKLQKSLAEFKET
jgi:RNA polymerase sigma-70 factor (ECF subfamily)